MSTIRSFIAIELSDEARLALTALQNRLKAVSPDDTVRWTALENIHLTLHFLGDVAVTDLEKVAAALQSGASGISPFSLTLGGLGCFPNMRRPRIVWTGVLGETKTLLELHHRLGERLKTLGFTLEARPYSPHLTIGRVKKEIPTRSLAQLGQALEQEQPTVGQLAGFNVAEISLMKSELRPTGVVYTQVAAAKLTASRYLHLDKAN